MEQNKERKGLFKFLKSSSITRNEKNTSTLFSPSVKPARSVITNKIHSQRQVERKEQRDKLITQNRARTTSVSSNVNSRHNTPSHPNIKPPTVARTQSSITKPRPVTKPPPVVPKLPPKTTQNDSLSTTYTVDQTQIGSNLSRQGTISSLNRKKLLDDWKQKKQDQEKSKPKKPVFKPSGVDVSKSTVPTGIVPTSSSFNFSMSIPGSSMTRSTSLRKPEVLKPPSSLKPSVSKPPVRSQSVRQTNVKETPKLVPKQRETNLTRKPIDKELEIITKKLNDSMNIKPKKPLEIKIEEAGLNETRLDTVIPTHTSSPIKKQIQTRDYFDKIQVDKRDVKFYRDLVNFETQELNVLGDLWTGISTSTGIPDDIQGDIRSAVGLAKLLIDERFSQFNDLINQCEETSKSDCGLVVKCTDLQGFWDMVDVQVKDVCKKFELLSKIKENNYVKTPDMIEIPVVVEKKVFKPNRNYLKKKDQKNEDIENESEKVEKPAKPVVNRLAEFKAKMKAMKTKTDDIEIKIAKKESPIKESPKSTKKTRRSVRKSVVFNELPVEKKYNLRSRPSDLIKFDSPLAVRNGLENVAEESNTSNMLSSPVAIVKKSKKKSIYPVISEDDLDKENDDLFSLDDCPQITWKTRPSIYPTVQTPSRILMGTPNRVSMNRESISSTVASSPLLKLALISSQSKRLSVNSLNRIFDKLE